MTSSRPLVTIVVASRDLSKATEATVESLAAQTRLRDLEVLLVDGHPDGGRAVQTEGRGWLRSLSLPGANLPAMKEAGIRAARGEHVAILDPSTTASSTWVDELLLGLADERTAAVGGSVLPPPAASAADLGAFLFEYGGFHPPLAAGATAGDLPGNNVAYRRCLLIETCSEVLNADGFNKPFVHERLRRHGWRLVLRPEMQVRQIGARRLWPFLVRRFHYGRCFGATRWRRASLRKRILYTALAPAVPALLTIRHLIVNLAHPRNRQLLLRAGPALLCVCCMWGVGEWLGYWFGAGNSCREFY